MSLIPTHRTQRLGDLGEFKTNLVYIHSRISRTTYRDSISKTDQPSNNNKKQENMGWVFSEYTF